LQRKKLLHQKRLLTSKVFCLAIFFACFVVLPNFSASTTRAQGKQRLDKNYKDWLEHDVIYIINKDERDEFLRLTTNEARDKFIEQFWEVRNPEPGSPTNSYKDEIYRRIAFANARFGIGSGAEGWRSDRGRTYITLGEPQQKQVLPNSANLYPIQIWFYANPSSSLPTAFYVMFYQRDGGGDYRFYSPYMDGPDKLVTGVEAINSPSAALKLINSSVGPEVARISLSLLPDEPVDLSSGQRSLESDILLDRIKSLPNLPESRSEIARRRALKESVTSRLLFDEKKLDVVTFPVRDSRGLTRLDYAVRLHSPSDLALTKEDDGRLSYAIEVRVIVFSAENKPIFTQQKTLRDSIDKKSLERIQDKVFGYQGSLPLPPGKYLLDFQFTDWSKKAAYTTHREISIPAVGKDGLIIPAILPFLSAEEVDPTVSDLTPFAFGGVKFNPMPNPSPTVAPGTNLQVMYQVWAPARDPREYAGQSLQIDYALGRPAAPGSVTHVKDELSMEQFDVRGNIVTGKKLSLEQQTVGNYLLSLTVNRPGSNDRAFASAKFRILDADSAPAPWDVLEPGISQDAETGILDQQRGLCYLAQGEPDQARGWLRRSLQLNHANDPARARLVDAYFSRKDYAAVVSLYHDASVTDTTDSETLLRIATSLEKTGKPKDAISLLESVLHQRPEEGPLYLALAGYYDEIGNVQKANELARKGKSYLTPDGKKPSN
jgi:GWxTD domain-containing protein